MADGKVGERGRPWVIWLADRLPIVVFIGVFGWLALRHSGIWHPQFVVEEAAAYWAMTFATDPIRFLVDAWIGYLEVIPRAAFLVARLGPPEIAPAVLRVMHVAIIASVAAFMVSRRMAQVIPEIRIRLVIAVAIALLPAREAYDSILSLHWFTALFLVALSLVPDRRWHDYPVAALLIVSGLPAAMAAPAFWPRRDRLAVMVTVLAGLQFALPLLADRNRHGLDVAAFVDRAGVAGLVIVVLTIIVARHVPWPILWRFGMLGLATAVAGGLSAGHAIITPEFNSRYFVAAWMIVAVVVAYGLARRDLMAAALAVAFLVTRFAPTVAAPTTDTRWAEHARCIGGSVPCTVPIDPPEWSVHWPGHPTLYQRPALPQF